MSNIEVIRLQANKAVQLSLILGNLNTKMINDEAEIDTSDIRNEAMRRFLPVPNVVLIESCISGYKDQSLISEAYKKHKTLPLVDTEGPSTWLQVLVTYNSI